MSTLKQELFETFANELNNNSWEFDGAQVAVAATDGHDNTLIVSLTDGRTVTLSASVRRRRIHEQHKAPRRGQKSARSLRS